MTRALLLALALTATPTASAQDAPSGWRVAPSAGIVTTFQPTLGLRVERASAPVHIGVRGWAITDGLGTDDGATIVGRGTQGESHPLMMNTPSMLPPRLTHPAP